MTTNSKWAMSADSAAEPAAINEHELVEATGASLILVRAWLNGDTPMPIGLRRAINTITAYSEVNEKKKSQRSEFPGHEVHEANQAEEGLLTGNEVNAEGRADSPVVITAPEQKQLFPELKFEKEDFLKTQLITYIGNKRSLLPFLELGIRHAKEKIGKDQIDFLDLFSGSGVVARKARQHARVIHCNDLEVYSEVANLCYQANAADVNAEALAIELQRVECEVRETYQPGFIAELYAPRNDDDIKAGERVFYTRRNAIFLGSKLNQQLDLATLG